MAPAARIIDLDLIGPPPLVIRKGGVEYRLPGDPPTDLWLALVAAQDAYQAAAPEDIQEALQTYHDRMLDLFRIEQPDMETLPFGSAGMFAVLCGFYGGFDDDEPDPPRAEEADSTTTTSNGSATTAAAKRKTRSRSSR